MKTAGEKANIQLTFARAYHPKIHIPTSYELTQDYTKLQTDNFPLNEFKSMSVDGVCINSTDAQMQFISNDFTLIPKESEESITQARGIIITYSKIPSKKINEYQSYTRFAIAQLIDQYRGIAVSFKNGTLYKSRRNQEQSLQQILGL